MKSQTFKKVDLRHIADAFANGVTQKEIDKFELGLDTNTQGLAKDSRAATIVNHIFNGDDPDDVFLSMLDFIYLESESSEAALASEEYVRLKKVLDQRGIHLTDEGFRVATPSSAEQQSALPESSLSGSPQPPSLATPAMRSALYAGPIILGLGGRSESPEISPSMTTAISTPTDKEPEAIVNQPDNNKVFIVQGRDQRPVQVLETFLHFTGLDVMSWNDAVDLTGKPTPDTYDVIREAMKAAAVIIVVFSPDDEARLKPALAPGKPVQELQGQPRQNVLLEAGMAFAMAPLRTLFVKSEATRDISDIAGFNWVTMDGEWESREALVRRLQIAKAPVKLHSENLKHNLAGPFKV